MKKRDLKQKKCMAFNNEDACTATGKTNIYTPANKV